jgi:Protein of unknown function (DUF4236)
LAWRVRFHRRFRIAPGFTLNLSKRGVSVSAGVRGAHVTFGRCGRRVTIGLPGTGLSATDYQRYPYHGAAPRPLVALVWLVLGLLVVRWFAGG